MNLKHKLVLSAAVVLSAAAGQDMNACTGISLVSRDTSHVLARTCEWGGSFLQSRYVVVPRGYTQTAFTPEGKDGLSLLFYNWLNHYVYQVTPYNLED